MIILYNNRCKKLLLGCTYTKNLSFSLLQVLAIAAPDKLNSKTLTNRHGCRTLHSPNENKSESSGKKRTYTNRDNSSVSYSIQAPKTKIPRRKTENASSTSTSSRIKPSDDHSSAMISPFPDTPVTATKSNSFSREASSTRMSSDILTSEGHSRGVPLSFHDVPIEERSINFNKETYPNCLASSIMPSDIQSRLYLSFLRQQEATASTKKLPKT